MEQTICGVMISRWIDDFNLMILKVMISSEFQLRKWPMVNSGIIKRERKTMENGWNVIILDDLSLSLSRMKWNDEV